MSVLRQQPLKAVDGSAGPLPHDPLPQALPSRAQKLQPWLPPKIPLRYLQGWPAAASCSPLGLLSSSFCRIWPLSLTDLIKDSSLMMRGLPVSLAIEKEISPETTLFTKSSKVEFGLRKPIPTRIILPKLNSTWANPSTGGCGPRCSSRKTQMTPRQGSHR